MFLQLPATFSPYQLPVLETFLDFWPTAVNVPFLDTWARKLAQWHRQGITPYVFCHCPFTVHAPEICTSLYQKVADLIPHPPLSEKKDATVTGLEQARLF
jgi:uncharacterized protein YecE (DUF72 family)